MNKESTVKSDWAETRNLLKAKFHKLTEEAIDSLKGDIDQLSMKLQSVYGYAREQADKELRNFKAALHEATKSKPIVLIPVPVPVDPKGKKVA